MIFVNGYVFLKKENCLEYIKQKYHTELKLVFIQKNALMVENKSTN